MNRDRRAQQLVREHLSDGKQRFSAPDKVTARKRIAYLRSVMERNNGHKGGRRGSPRSSHISGTLQAPSLVEPARLYKTPAHSSTHPEAVENRWSNDTLDIRADSGTFRSDMIAPTSNDLFDFDFDEYTYLYQLDTEAWLDPLNTNTTTAYEAVDDVDASASVLSRRRRLRKVISQRSFNSSLVSDLLSLLDKRFSFSTTGMSDRVSLSAASVAEAEIKTPEALVIEVLHRHRQYIEKSNLTLQEECCSKTENCAHSLIKKLALCAPGIGRKQVLEAPLTRGQSYPQVNNTLCYAARIGAPPEFIIPSLMQPNVKALNPDGQTFLYFFNPRLFHAQTTCFHLHPAHSTYFVCFIRTLERANFDFDRLDHSGRPFLFFLCSSPTFDVQWLLDLMAQDDQWDFRVWRMAQLRDATGLFLIDFIALHPDFETMTEDIRSRFRPHWIYSAMDQPQSRLLWDEDKEGRPNSQLYLRHFLYTLPLQNMPFPTGGVISDINRYNSFGRTAIMDYLQHTVQHGIDEDIICMKIKALILCGANVNARFRDGCTILHLAAKKALPKLLEFLLATDIQVDHCDDSGNSALFYATQIFQRSRSAKAPAEVTARSLKSTANLLNAITPAFVRGRSADARNSERASQTMQGLLRYHSRNGSASGSI
jgi:hypothetical protein